MLGNLTKSENYETNRKMVYLRNSWIQNIPKNSLDSF